MGRLWERTLAELQLVVPRQEFTAWISCLRTAGDADETLTVEAPSAFHRSWVQRHFLERIRTTVTSVAGRPVPVVLAVGVHAAVETGGRASEDALALTSPAPIRIRAPKPGEGNREPTFANFVVGACNRLAHAAARAVATAPGRRYNPLCIYGGVGLGKTHLIHAIAGDLRTRFRSARVLAIGAELFVNEMVSAVRRQQMETFHHRFRRIDTLLVDDVQFIAGKERTQEEFLHTFNLLCAAGKQIVVSSDKPPRDISNLEAGLRSRFEGGLMTEVTPPDVATRRLILDHKAAEAGLTLPPDVAAYLAERIRATSVRELEGAITRIGAIASLTGRTVDRALAEEVVVPLRASQQLQGAADRIESVVAAALGLDVRTLRSPRRDAPVVLARQLAMYLLRKVSGLSFALIGERYGRDHTTVLHAVRVVSARRDRDPEVGRLVSALEEKL